MCKLVLLSVAALILTACSGEKVNQSETSSPAVSVQETSDITIKGSLSYRERIALRPGLTARITLSDVSIADRKAPILANQEFELRGLQVPIPFALKVDKDVIKPNGRYAVRGTLIGPEGAKLWTTDTVHLIDNFETEQDLGTLTIVRTGARPSTRLAFYVCGKKNVETRLSDGDMTVIIDGEETNLPKVPAASGTKYKAGSGADRIMFWDKGETAQLQIGDKTYPDCVRDDLK